MKQILFILIIWTMLPFHGYARNPYHESNTVPKGFECFQMDDRQNIFIEYTVPVNGYSVKVMHTNYNARKHLQDETILYFENEEINSKFFVRTNNFYYYDRCFTDEETTESEEVIICENEPPCAFIDVDFDEKEELVIYCYEHCSEVYNLENAYPELITDKPFTELDENSKFDPISKTFTNVFYAGGGDKTVFTYQKQDYYYWYTDRVGAYNTYKFELVNVDVKEYNVIPITRHKVYQRIGNKLELVKKELIIENWESLKLLEEDLETCQDQLLSKEYEDFFNDEE